MQTVQVLQAMFPAVALYLLAIAVVLLAGHGARRLESEERAAKYFYLARNLTAFLVVGVGYSVALTFQVGEVNAPVTRAGHLYFMAIGLPACVFLQLNKWKEQWLMAQPTFGLMLLALSITFFLGGVVHFDVARQGAHYNSHTVNTLILVVGIALANILLSVWYFLKGVFLPSLPRH